MESLLGHVGIVSLLFWEHIGMYLGTLWEGFQIGLERCLEKQKKIDEVKTFKFSDLFGSIFLDYGYSKQLF